MNGKKERSFSSKLTSFSAEDKSVSRQTLASSVQGETDITVGAVNQVSQSKRPAFDRTLETPSRRPIFEIVPGETVHEVGVPTDKPRSGMDRRSPSMR